MSAFYHCSAKGCVSGVGSKLSKDMLGAVLCLQGGINVSQHSDSSSAWVCCQLSAQIPGFLCIFLSTGGILCLGQIKVAELCSQILGQNNLGPRPRDTQGCNPTAQLNCHLLAAALLACGGQGPGCDVQKAGCPCGADFSLIFSCWSILNKPFPSVTLL